MLEPNGLDKVTVRSLIQVCVPVIPTTLTSEMDPLIGIFRVEVMVGVPVPDIATGILVLMYVVQLLVAKEWVAEKGPVVQLLVALTRQ